MAFQQLCRRSALLGACLAGAAVAQLRIISPASVGVIDGSTATFGAPFYGDSVMGQVVLAESRGQNYCAEDDYDVPSAGEGNGLLESSQQKQLIDIFLVRRGNCSFASKARIAQAKGAHALVIVDQEDSPLTSTDLSNIIVADDGTGGSVHIPTVLISKEDGKRLIDTAKRQAVVVALEWNIPTDHVVQVDLWMSSGSTRSLRFLQEFAPIRRQLNQVLRFQPHYAVFGLPASQASGAGDLCSDASGEFCAEAPDGDAISGKEVLEEDVRQLCIHELSKVTQQSPEKHGSVEVDYAAKYWDYVAMFAAECPAEPTASGSGFLEIASERRFGSACSQRIMRAVGLDVKAVDECVTRTSKRKLQAERRNTAWSPRALRINGWRYSGMVEADLVARAICSGFLTPPSECDALLVRDPFAKYAGGAGGMAGSGDGAGVVSFTTLALSLGLLVVFCFLTMLLHRRMLRKSLGTKIREEVMLEVSSQMASYSQLPADL